MSLTTRCLRTLRQPSPPAIGLSISSHRLSRSTPHSNFKITHGQRRAFSLTSVLDTSQDLILGLHHATGTPWYVTIPMVAIGVAAIFRLPFQIYSQKVIQQRTKYVPLILGWNAKELIDAAKSQKYTKDGSIKIAIERGKKHEKRIYKKAGLQQWKMISGPLASAPAWLIAIESIRRLAGGPRGLAGHIAMNEKGRTAKQEWSNLPQVANNDLPEAVTQIDPSAAAWSAVDGFTYTLEPSFMTEGCLWFTDLTAADPYHILPYALSATLVINAFPKTEAGIRQLFGLDRNASNSSTTTVYATSPIRRGLARSFLIFSVAIGPLTINLPAAIHLYWLSSAIAGFMIRYLVNRLWPVASENIMKPCTSLRESPFVKPVEELENTIDAARMARSNSRAARQA